MQDKVLSLLGVCQRAGKVESGNFLCGEALTRGRAKLILIAGDAKENTRKDLENGCRSRGVPFRIYADKERLGHAIGKSMRSCAAITDDGLARNLIRVLDSQQGERGQNVEENH